MATELTQRDLRNNSGEIMRRLDSGESFLVTRNGVPVAELTPIRRRRFVDRDRLHGLFAQLHAQAPAGFRDDVDAWVDQNPAPRV